MLKLSWNPVEPGLNTPETGD